METHIGLSTDAVQFVQIHLGIKINSIGLDRKKSIPRHEVAQNRA